MHEMQIDLAAIPRGHCSLPLPVENASDRYAGREHHEQIDVGPGSEFAPRERPVDDHSHEIAAEPCAEWHDGARGRIDPSRTRGGQRAAAPVVERYARRMSILSQEAVQVRIEAKHELPGGS